jgi:hypothetical protein
MNTKSFLLTFGLFLSFLAVHAQELNTVLTQKLENYIELSNKGEWSQVFDQTYPKLYTRVSKEELITLMEQNEAGMTMHTSNLRTKGFTVPVEEGNETYVRIDYEADVKVTIRKGGIYDDQKPIIGLEQQFKDTYGNPNVRYNADTREFDIRSHSAIMAVKSGEGDWKFVEINMKQPKVMESLFSPAIMDALVRVE